MAKVYHVVPAAYDGFSLDYPETELKSPMDEAKRLSDYYKIITAYGGKTDILYGVFSGWRGLIEVLSNDRLKITTMIPSSCPFVTPQISGAMGPMIYLDHGGLAEEHPEEFLKEVQTTRPHRA